MQQLLSGIDDCLSKENWFGALFIAISLPDICGATEDKIKGNGARYKDWFNRYLKPRYNADNMYEYLNLTNPSMLQGMPEEMKDSFRARLPIVSFSADDCWSLRNACLHEGVDETKLRKFKITIPARENLHTHMNIFNGVLQLDVIEFCNDIAAGARKWLFDMQNEPDVMAKLNKMMTIDSLIFDGFIDYKNVK
ncbi:hypothetical protein JW313_03590 [Enterobacter cloacae subsp. cloacae]|uniref:hypothetical protein n=1 Tax=Enterobacter TaxID=547 RepID=UPI000F831F8F|nr:MULTISPECIES: hypothetical protein [Enterobacter]MBW4214369.1 hypothetical protein [Enterobacter cloacae subsp. cloacae]RTP94517.1 hypothetical protein EKN38_24700 [Enterobacter sp. WCHEn045836]HCT8370483.1 hypothetical protein [Enterobacter cloacae]